jgi:Domain of unknown function (DUF4926)
MIRLTDSPISDGLRRVTTMPDRYKLFDVVRLPNGVPGRGVAPGATGAIVDIHEQPTLAYEVEIVDAETGRTIWWGSVLPEQLEPAQ